MDVVTDQKVTSLVQSEFYASTVVTIAHRLSTVMACDRVCVMDRGRIVEVGAPVNLLSDSSTQFFSLAQSAGLI